MQPVDALRREHQFGQRHLEQRAHLCARPVVPHAAESVAL